MQSKGVEEDFHEVHAQEDAKGHGPEHGLSEEDRNSTVRMESRGEYFVKDDLREFRMSERQCPESQVRCSIGDSA
jgi:hypothetical protein